MFWNKIFSWFRDMSERNKLLREWNEEARTSYIQGLVPVLLEANISKGDSRYKHSFSRLLFSGFRIQIKGTHSLTKEEILDIGRTILHNQNLVRKMILLGWDTLEILDVVHQRGVKWAFKDFANIGMMLN
ncbi:hypothetical protein NQ494_05415 [Butyricimonas virosa]|uniref:Uncharacterized protein n=1 Tax=Butyricimonas virosa TaxID=544645 RepID=A0ABX7H6L1_9BACT|nr:hypothetical protein [Butyricimonas virosa]QRO50690.1 hypothetical protein I6J59_03405 [Butyricimonas virosa]UWO48598.1 hypothetical protein NQ494_05415 [Butyricimonas virosa]